MKYGWKMGRTWGIIPMASIPICTTYNTLKMVHLNYNNLDDETQERLLSMSKKDIEKEKIVSQKAQIVGDLIAAENAYTDVKGKYERTKQLITKYKNEEEKASRNV